MIFPFIFIYIIHTPFHFNYVLDFWKKIFNHVYNKQISDFNKINKLMYTRFLL